MQKIKLPFLAWIIFLLTLVMTACSTLAYATSYLMDPELLPSDMRTSFLVRIISGSYFFIFSVAALCKYRWGLAGYRLGLIVNGLLIAVTNFYDESSASGIIFMLFLTVVELVFLFAIWKYLGTHDVIAVYAQQSDLSNQEKPEASLD